MPMLRGRCLPCDFERAFTNLAAGIRVVTVSPGFIETDAATRMIQRMADKDKSDYTTAWQKLILRGRLRGRSQGRSRNTGKQLAMGEHGDP